MQCRSATGCSHTHAAHTQRRHAQQHQMHATNFTQTTAKAAWQAGAQAYTNIPESGLSDAKCDNGPDTPSNTMRQRPWKGYILEGFTTQRQIAVALVQADLLFGMACPINAARQVLRHSYAQYKAGTTCVRNSTQHGTYMSREHSRQTTQLQNRGHSETPGWCYGQSQCPGTKPAPHIALHMPAWKHLARWPSLACGAAGNVSRSSNFMPRWQKFPAVKQQPAM